MIILGLIFPILAMIGIYGFYSKIFILCIIGGVAVIIENLIGVLSGEQNNLTTAIISIIVGIILTGDLFIGAMIGLCFEGAVMSVGGWLLLLIMSFKK